MPRCGAPRPALCRLLVAARARRRRGPAGGSAPAAAGSPQVGFRAAARGEAPRRPGRCPGSRAGSGAAARPVLPREREGPEGLTRRGRCSQAGGLCVFPTTPDAVPGAPFHLG